MVDQDQWLVDVPIHGVTTPYRVIGDAFAWLCLAGAAALVGFGVFRRRPPAFAPPERATGREPEFVAR